MEYDGRGNSRRSTSGSALGPGQPGLAAAEHGSSTVAGAISQASRASPQARSYSTAATSTHSVASPSRAAPGTSRRCRRPSDVWGRQPAPGQHEDHDADRHVDEEHQPPAEVGPAERDQARRRRAGRRGADTDGRADGAERPSAGLAGEHLLDQARDLRVDQPAGEALQHPGGDQERRPGREAGQRAGHHEAGDPDQEHQPPAVVVAEPAGDDRDQPEGERVPETTHCSWAGPARVASPIEGQRDIGDADVQQGHEQCAAADEQGDPAAAVGLGRFSDERVMVREARVPARPACGELAFSWRCPSQKGSTQKRRALARDPGEDERRLLVAPQREALAQARRVRRTRPRFLMVSRPICRSRSAARSGFSRNAHSSSTR